MAVKVGFLMDQIAGHITNYKNLRRAAASEPDFTPVWHEIIYYKEGGNIERLGKIAPSYAIGVSRASFETWKGIHSGRYDALFSNVSVGVFFPISLRRIPTMIDFDSTPMQLDKMPAYTPKPDPAPVARLKWLLCRDHFRAARLIQVWSRWAKQSVVEDYGIPAEKVVINPPGVDLELWRPRPERRKHGDSIRRVLFVGGDFTRKGGQLLLEWFQTSRPPDTELHIVTREDVPESPGVHVYRNVTPNSEQLIQLYADADLFVLPSLAECFGIATVEAMAAGLPVIASDVGGTADIIEPGRNGFIVPGNDVGALSRAINDVLGEAPRRKAMGEQSRQLAEERFDLERNAHRAFGYLKQIAEEKRGAARASV